MGEDNKPYRNKSCGHINVGFVQHEPVKQCLIKYSIHLSHPNTRVPSLLMPNWAFCMPPLSCTILPSLTTFPRHQLCFVLKKPAFWATRHPAAAAVSSTVALWFIPQPPGPPGSRTDRVLRGSWTTVMWPADNHLSVTSAENRTLNESFCTSSHHKPIWSFLLCLSQTQSTQLEAGCYGYWPANSHRWCCHEQRTGNFWRNGESGRGHGRGHKASGGHHPLRLCRERDGNYSLSQYNQSEAFFIQLINSFINTGFY